MSTTQDLPGRLRDAADWIRKMRYAANHQILDEAATAIERLEAERDQLREIIADKNAALDLMREAADQLRAEVEALKAAARQDTQEKK